MPTWKSTYVAGEYISYYATNNAIHILNSPSLQRAVSAGNAFAVADAMKRVYATERRESLMIDTESLAIEIYGHVYPGKLFDKIKGLASVSSTVKKFVDSLSDRTEIIDCGESSVDGNRSIWDALVNLVIV
ncbi:hypothetical protein IHV09_22045 [Fictibacillus sp. 23RED33]|uniref:hypothetical protein n=1 Tax=Fictibacillus sp. 23RED33 TaxID=2745879 RepID=UPI0018CF63C8|nr:hypothetical protein [Fictibacillus sp. 23RED33]MBH0176242.1 hypothetical protein [Fictibacillus sp. 23RED33]